MRHKMLSWLRLHGLLMPIPYRDNQLPTGYIKVLVSGTSFCCVGLSKRMPSCVWSWLFLNFWMRFLILWMLLLALWVIWSSVGFLELPSSALFVKLLQSDVTAQNGEEGWGLLHFHPCVSQWLWSRACQLRSLSSLSDDQKWVLSTTVSSFSVPCKLYWSPYGL